MYENLVSLEILSVRLFYLLSHRVVTCLIRRRIKGLVLSIWAALRTIRFTFLDTSDLSGVFHFVLSPQRPFPFYIYFYHLAKYDLLKNPNQISDNL